MKEYKITEEMKEIYDEKQAFDDCRDSCLKMVFKTKKAIKFAKLSRQHNNKFWDFVYELYPELIGKAIHYTRATMAITIVDK